MANPKNNPLLVKNSILPTICSLIIPGLGQLVLKKRGRGLIILLTTILLVFITDWFFVHQNVGKVSLGRLTTSWLWLPLFLFWIWNVLDARALAENKKFSLLPGVLLAGIVVYVTAWNVTDVKLNRLVERFNDARTVATNLLNPDMITMRVNNEDQICAWQCMYKYIGDKLAHRTTCRTHPGQR